MVRQERNWATNSHTTGPTSDDVVSMLVSGIYSTCPSSPVVIQGHVFARIVFLICLLNHC